MLPACLPACGLLVSHCSYIHIHTQPATQLSPRPSISLLFGEKLPLEGKEAMFSQTFPEDGPHSQQIQLSAALARKSWPLS